jgi:hypothetical protein
VMHRRNLLETGTSLERTLGSRLCRPAECDEFLNLPKKSGTTSPATLSQLNYVRAAVRGEWCN